MTFPFAKNSPLYHPFEKALDKLKETGRVERIENDYFKEKEHEACEAGAVSIYVAK